MSCIISGVRKAKSKQSNVFQAINIIDFVAFESELKLSRIKEATLLHQYQIINQKVITSSVAMFIIDLARNAIKENESNPELYHFIKSSLLMLDQNLIEIKFAPHFFALDLTKYLGFGPFTNYTEDNIYFDLREGEFIDNDVRHNHILNRELSYDLLRLINKDEHNDINKTRRTELLDKIVLYYALHLDGFKELKCLNVLRSVLA